MYMHAERVSGWEDTSSINFLLVFLGGKIMSMNYELIARKLSEEVQQLQDLITKYESDIREFDQERNDDYAQSRTKLQKMSQEMHLSLESIEKRTQEARREVESIAEERLQKIGYYPSAGKSLIETATAASMVSNALVSEILKKHKDDLEQIMVKYENEMNELALIQKTKEEKVMEELHAREKEGALKRDFLTKRFEAQRFRLQTSIAKYNKEQEAFIATQEKMLAALERNTEITQGFTAACKEFDSLLAVGAVRTKWHDIKLVQECARIYNNHLEHRHENITEATVKKLQADVTMARALLDANAKLAANVVDKVQDDAQQSAIKELLDKFLHANPDLRSQSTMPAASATPAADAPQAPASPNPVRFSTGVASAVDGTNTTGTTAGSTPSIGR